MPKIDDISPITPPQPTSGQSKTSVVKPTHDANREAEIEKACRDFESLFVHHMMKQMRQSVPSDGLFGGGTAEKMYTSMLDGEIAKTVSEQRGIGLAPTLIRQLVEMTADEKKYEQKPQVVSPEADNENTGFSF